MCGGNAVHALRLQRHGLAAVRLYLRRRLDDDVLRVASHHAPPECGEHRRLVLAACAIYAFQVPPAELWMVERLLCRGGKVGERTYPCAVAHDLAQLLARARRAFLCETRRLVRDERVDALEAGQVAHLVRRRAERRLGRERKRGVAGVFCVRPRPVKDMIVVKWLRRGCAQDAVAHPVGLRRARRGRKSVRTVAAEVPIGSGESKARRHVREDRERGDRPRVRKVVLPPASRRERHAGLSHREDRRVIEAVRQHVPEKLLCVMAAACADHFAQGRHVAIRKCHLDTRVECLHVGAHRAAARRAHDAELRAVKIGARLHVVDGAHRVPDAESRVVPAHEPAARAEARVFCGAVVRVVVLLVARLAALALRDGIPRERGEAGARRHGKVRCVTRIEDAGVRVTERHQHHGIGRTRRSASLPWRLPMREGRALARPHRQSQMRRHVHAGLRLKDDVLEAESIKLGAADDARVERCARRHLAERVEPPRAPRRLLSLQFLRRADRRHDIIRRLVARRDLVDQRHVRQKRRERRFPEDYHRQKHNLHRMSPVVSKHDGNIIAYFPFFCIVPSRQKGVLK